MCRKNKRGKFRSSDGRLGNEFLFGGVLDEIRYIKEGLNLRLTSFIVIIIIIIIIMAAAAAAAAAAFQCFTLEFNLCFFKISKSIYSKIHITVPCETFSIGHFRVPKTLTFKIRLSAQPFLWK
ncbi:Cyclin-D1-binding protein 1 [Porites harrisoni]